MSEYWDDEAQRKYMRDRTRVMDWLYIHMPSVHRSASAVPIPFDALADDSEATARAMVKP